MRLREAQHIGDQLTKQELKAAQEWLLDLAKDSFELEDIYDWLDNVGPGEVVRKVDQKWDGGWIGFHEVFVEDVRRGCYKGLDKVPAIV